MKVNSERMWERIQELGEIGATPEGGVTRLAFSKEEREATDRMIQWMRELGLEVRTDGIGNLFARRRGKSDGPPVLMGSHLDSVPNGGKFDGAAGVVAALEVVQVLEEQGIETELPIEVVSFVNEEGSRFAGGLMGSSAVVGKLSENVLDTRDREGILLRDALKEYGVQPERIFDARLSKGAYTAFYELHIEQSVMLEEHDLAVGIVTGIAGPCQLTVQIGGRSGHAGATPMGSRRDPLVAAAMIIQEVERSAIEAGKTTRGTVGYVKAYPGAANVIPERVEFSLDYRDIDLAQRTRAIEHIKSYIATLCQERGLVQNVMVDLEIPPTVLDERVVKLLTETAAEQQLATLPLPSGAAHDAMNMHELCPTGMIFVRSKDGLSHCPEEYSTPEDLAEGANLLLHAVVKTANGALTG